MAYILNLETATKNCSVAIALDGKTIWCTEFAGEGYSHAEKLHVFIKQVLAETKLDFSDLTAVAISQGPGSYTGLRIGVSAAKGICFALDIPMIAVDTMKVLAAKANVDNGLIVPMLDARRMEVYSAIYDYNLQPVRKIQAEIITDESFSKFSETIYFVGDSAEKCKTVLTKENFNFLENVVYPSANEMSAISFEKFRKNDFVDVAYFEPFYLKDFFLQTKQ